MGKKRKPDASRLDEIDRNMYSTFCSAASSLSQLYTHAMHRQRLSFQAGERHAMEKLYNWILRQQQDGIRVVTGDVLAYIQNESNHGIEEPPSSPRQALQLQQLSQPDVTLSTQSGFPLSSNASVADNGQGLRAGIFEQNRNNVFSNALASSAHRSLQQYHLAQEGDNSNATRNTELNPNQTRYQNPQSFSDTPMDMHADGRWP